MLCPSCKLDNSKTIMRSHKRKGIIQFYICPECATLEYPNGKGEIFNTIISNINIEVENERN